MVPTPRSRELEAKAREAETRDRRARGELVEREAVVTGWDGEHVRLARALDGLPDRARLEEFAGSDDVIAWFHREIRAALEALAMEPPGCPAREPGGGGG